MNAIAKTLAIFSLLPGYAAFAQAQGADASTAGTPELATAAPPSDKTNYLGDRVKFQFAMFVSRVDMTVEPKMVSPACAPAFTTFRGIGSLKVGSDVHPAFIVTSVPALSDADKKAAKQGRCADASQMVTVNDVVIIKQDDLSSTPPDRYGLTYGTLLVPFKYHFKGDKDFSGGTSLGGYLGFRQDKSGITGLATQYVVFLGATSVSVPQTVNGNTTNQNMSGVSYGIGIIGTVKNSFNMGIIIGADRVNSSAGYKDNGKPWVAVSLGFDFSN